MTVQYSHVNIMVCQYRRLYGPNLIQPSFQTKELLFKHFRKHRLIICSLINPSRVTLFVLQLIFIIQFRNYSILEINNLNLNDRDDYYCIASNNIRESAYSTTHLAFKQSFVSMTKKSSANTGNPLLRTQIDDFEMCGEAGSSMKCYHGGQCFKSKHFVHGHNYFKQFCM